MTATKELTPEQRLTVIKHLAGGKSPDVVAAIVNLDRSTVIDIGAHHGYPDTDKLKWAADVLTNKIDENRQPTPGTPPRPAARPGPAAVDQAPLQRTTPLTQPDEIRVLLNTAKAHPSKRIQAAADQLFDRLDRLRALLREDEEKHAERRKADAQKAAARAEVKRLEEQLAAAKAKLRGAVPAAAKASGAPSDGPSAAEIRSWATTAGVKCPTRGQIPTAVREQYDKAHAA